MLVKIYSHSFIARLAAAFRRTERIAIVFGNNIYLFNTSRQDFTKHTRWLRHELMHVQQYQQHGTLRFIILYLFEYLKNGYYNNKFEQEARAAENNTALPVNFLIE